MPIIPVLTAASGLDIFLRDGAGNLADPTSITYDITEPGATLVADDAAPFKRSTGHYDARTTTIPSGFSTASPWTITWTWTSPGGITSSKSEEFTVSESLGGSFSDIDKITTQIKKDIALSATELTDSDIEVFIQKALDRLNLKLNFEGTSKELSFNDSLGTINPSPSSTIRAMIVMQAECLILKRRHADAVTKGIKVRDGDSEIDTTAGFRGHGDVVGSVCDDLEVCISRFLSGQEGGAAEHGGLIWAGNSRNFEDADHDGQSSETRDFRSQFGASASHGHFSSHRNW